ncbi:MAG TPA: metallopeptidase TldD-related protein [Streptosporangiaceae bacterium]|nr:metallopeptidase TldD-related protein [Streptosporangiaceae bacterium]
MSRITEVLNEEAARRNADSEAWDMTHETEEVVCRNGQADRRAAICASAVALTVWRDGREGYAAQSPATGTSLVDMALAVGQALGSGASSGTNPPRPSPGPASRQLTLPRLSLDDGHASDRLASLTTSFPAEIELRARVDQYRVDLHRAGTEPLTYASGTFRLQAQATVRAGRVGFASHQMSGRAAERVMTRAEQEDLPELARLASVLASEPVRDLSYDHMLLDGRVVAALLSLAIPAFQLDSVLEGRSRLARRSGEQVGARGLWLADDPASADSPLLIPWDDEGTECGPTVLLQDGVLQGFLSSRRTAAAHGSPSTGSGRRGTAGEMPTVQHGFLVLRHATSLGHDPREDGTVLYVAQANGAHTSNSITGNFSVGANAVVVSPGHELNAGKITLAGNVFDLLRSIEGHDGRVRVSGSNRSFVATPGLWVTGLVVGR